MWRVFERMTGNGEGAGVRGVRRPISWHLTKLVLATALPMLAALGVALLTVHRHEIDRARADVLSAAHRLGDLVERELDGYVAALQGLATSTAIERADWGQLDTQARVLAGQRGSAISLRRLDAQQLINTFAPPGSKLPVSTDPILRDADARAVSLGSPVVSDLYVGAVAKRHFVLAVVPVPASGPAKYLLNIAVLPERLSELIGRGLQPEWMAIVVDSRNRIIARSAEIESYVGKLSTPEQIGHMSARTGAWKARRLDGVPVLVGHVTLRSGWKAVIAVPEASIWAQTNQAFALLAAGAAFATALSLALSFRAARRLESEVRLLASPHRSACEADFRLVELHDVARELDAHERHRARAQQAQEHLAAIVASSNDAIITIDTGGSVISWNRGAENLFGYKAAEMVGTDIRRIVPPDRLAETEDNFASAASGRSYRTETARLRKDGSVVEVAIRAAPILDGAGKTASISIVAVEITERKRAERQRELLLKELDHRLKNVFATVSALVGLSARSAGDVNGYATSLRQRIHALSEVHNLVRGTGLESATSMREIARTIAVGSAPAQIEIDGPDVSLSATSAIAVGMIFNELLTNAIKYGALATAEGRVTLRWTTDGELCVTWSEICPTPPEAARPKGFGWLMIEQNAASLNGKARFTLEPHGLVFTLICPLTSLDRATPPREKNA